MGQYLEHTVKKRKATRVAYRTVGFVFMLLGGLLIWWAIAGGAKIIKAAIAAAAIGYGFTLVKSSFRKSAFDSIYIFEDEGMRIKQAKREILIPYNKLTNINLVIPDPNMPYYILKIDKGTENFVLPFAGKRDKCNEIYEFLLKKVGIYEEKNTDDIEE
ncbi:MAG: hypothetical protein ACI4EF_00470 [Coprococcus sp.]